MLINIKLQLTNGYITINMQELSQMRYLIQKLFIVLEIL